MKNDKIINERSLVPQTSPFPFFIVINFNYTSWMTAGFQAVSFEEKEEKQCKGELHHFRRGRANRVKGSNDYNLVIVSLTYFD